MLKIMLILNKEFKNKNNFNYLKNKIYINKGQSKHYPSSVKEWYNSIYNYNKDNYTKILPINDLYIYKLFNSYFNANRLKIYKNFSILNIYISKPDIKHYSNKINITLFVYNKQIVYLLRDFLIYKKILNKLDKLVINKWFNIKIKYLSKYFLFILNFYSFKKVLYKYKYINTYITNNMHIKKRYLINKLFNLYHGNNNIIYTYINNIINRLFIYILCKSEFLMLNILLNKYKFNIKNLLNIKSLLNKLYNKNIELNIVNLKYLYLDSNILAASITRKLKNRNRRILRVIRMALKLSKKSYLNEYYTQNLNSNGNINIMLIKKSLNLFSKNIPLNMNILNKPYFYKNRIILYYLNNKIINGIKLQGTGRLTKRLTASRSITKNSHKGSLRNNKSSLKGLSTIMLRGYVKSNLQYININSYNLIGAYGIKSWISNF